MHTWLTIFRGDPLDGGTPIGIVTDPALCRAAVREALAEFHQHVTEAEQDADPVLRAGFEGIERRLTTAAEELETEGPPRQAE